MKLGSWIGRLFVNCILCVMYLYVCSGMYILWFWLQLFHIFMAMYHVMRLIQDLIEILFSGWVSIRSNLHAVRPG